ncbi:MAG: homocysteine S-methyltransferase family protein [Bryobacteraceae bacterium]|nr:homocysteine S-methyltransferase family protein [Bryobacteraceae bacterium]
MSQISEWLKNGPLLSDGAWGTELIARGLEPGTCPDLWNLTNPEAVASVARAYVEAGSRVILTNTFRANPVSLPADCAARAAEINAAGVRISKQAAGSQALVFASIGPTGRLILAGEISEGEVRAAYDVQTKALAGAGADALLIETQSDPDEAEIILRAAKATGLPVVVSFTFDTGKAHDRTLTGAKPEQVAARMEAAGADAIGSNCGAGIDQFLGLCQRLRAVTQLPLWMKPNAGLPVVEDGKLHYRQSPEEFAAHLPALLEAGASFVGGCCGTSPAFVAALKERFASCASA